MKLSPFAGKMCVTVDVQEHNIRNYTHVILRKMSFNIFHNFFFLQEFAIMVILNIA